MGNKSIYTYIFDKNDGVIREFSAEDGQTQEVNPTSFIKQRYGITKVTEEHYLRLLKELTQNKVSFHSIISFGNKWDVRKQTGNFQSVFLFWYFFYYFPQKEYN